MAIGTVSNFQIYQDQVHGGIVETLARNTDAFNAASRNAIRLISNRLRGNFAQESFVQNISGIVSRRDNTVVTSATDLAVTQDEFTSVKVNRKFGPIANTLDSWRKIQAGEDSKNLSFLIGTQIAKGMQADQLNTGLAALTGALTNVGATVTVTSGANLTTQNLVSSLALFGDRADRIGIWVMHSKPFYDLVSGQITANIDGVSNFNVATGTPITLNRPVLVVDDPALVVTGSPTGDDDYYTLGLQPNALVVEDSEEEEVFTDVVTGLENIVVRLQGEFAYNVGLKGFKYSTGAGANPNAATISTGSNWTNVMNDIKDLGGVVIQTK